MAAFSDDINGVKMLHAMIVFEIIFIIDMCLKFFKSFTKDGETNPTRDLGLIADRYVKGSFIFDLIPLLPIP
jgi:hypothetical protein